ncbi:MAG: hypothetical protein Q8K03_06695 [Methylotenera sp.]|nr:hypothetical protein [Methylotenera sp.]
MKTYEDLERYVLRSVRDIAGEHVCKQVIRNLMRMPAGADDHEVGLNTFWDSICYQMQVGQSFLFDMYLIDVDQQVEYYTRQLTEYQITALYLSTNEALSLYNDYDELNIYDFIDAVVLEIRNEYLLESAKSWSNKKIRKAIDA